MANEMVKQKSGANRLVRTRTHQSLVVAHFRRSKTRRMGGTINHASGIKPSNNQYQLNPNEILTAM